MDATYNLNGGFKPTIKRFADLSGPDFFPTPRWATFALIENEKFDGEIWECACGNGAMSGVLEETGQPVISSDLFDRGYGDAGKRTSISPRTTSANSHKQKSQKRCPKTPANRTMKQIHKGPAKVTSVVFVGLVRCDEWVFVK